MVCLICALEGLSVEASEVDFVTTIGLNINPCRACYACWFKTSGKCVQKDDATKVMEKIRQADMLVIASPVYFYGLSAQLKAIIDRCHNPIRDTFKIKKTAILLVGAATLPELFDSILAQYQLCLNFFKLEDAGRVLVRGVKDKGDIKVTTNSLFHTDPKLPTLYIVASNFLGGVDVKN